MSRSFWLIFLGITVVVLGVMTAMVAYLYDVGSGHADRWIGVGGFLIGVVGLVVSGGGIWMQARQSKITPPPGAGPRWLAGARLRSGRDMYVAETIHIDRRDREAAQDG